jgi:hypothetical protein
MAEARERGKGSVADTWLPLPSLGPYPPFRSPAWQILTQQLRVYGCLDQQRSCKVSAQAVENKRALTLAPCWSILSLRRAGSDGKEQVP